MATSAARAQLLTAERIWHGNQAHANWGIIVDGKGRIEHIGPTQAGEVGQLHFDNRILVPGLIDAFAPGCLSTNPLEPDGSPHPAEPPPLPITLAYPETTASPSALYARLRTALLARLRAGIVCVGVPHIIGVAPPTSAGSSPYPLVDLMVAAAQDVGMRLAVLVGPSPHLSARDALDLMCEGLRGLVAHVVSFADLRISWGLVLPKVDQLPLDAIVALKLRMAHLPLQMAAEPLEHPHTCVSDAAKGLLLERLGLWQRAGILDAATTILLAQPPPLACARLMADSGSTWVALHGLPSPAQRAAGERGEGALGFGTGSLPVLPHRLPTAALAAWQRPAGEALGLRAPGWAPGRWADLIALPWPWGPQPVRQASSAGLEAVDVIIGGQLALRGGRHRFDDPAR